MTFIRTSVAVLCLAVLALPAAAQKLPEAPAMRAVPAGAWSVDFDDRQCILKRSYTVDGRPALFALNLEPVTHTAWLRFGIADQSGARGDGDAVMTVDGARLPGTLHYNIFSTDTHRVREYMLDLRRHDFGTVKQRIRFWTRKDGDVEIDAASFPAAWTAVRTCMDDLHASFGIKPEDLARIAVPPRGSVFPFIDYPPGSGPSDFAFLYWVAEDGKVDACKLVLPSGMAKFDAELCTKLTARGRFTPARDPEGKAIRAPVYEYARLRVAAFNSPSP